MAAKKKNLEDSLLRLQEISSILESGEEGLEESIKLYEEGIKLSEFCYKVLKDAELKVTELKEEFEGSMKDSLSDE